MVVVWFLTMASWWFWKKDMVNGRSHSFKISQCQDGAILSQNSADAIVIRRLNPTKKGMGMCHSYGHNQFTEMDVSKAWAKLHLDSQSFWIYQLLEPVWDWSQDSEIGFNQYLALRLAVCSIVSHSLQLPIYDMVHMVRINSLSYNIGGNKTKSSHLHV